MIESGVYVKILDKSEGECEFDIISLVWRSTKSSGASSIEVTMPNLSTFIKNGQKVRAYVDNTLIFEGYIFYVQSDNFTLSFKAYDSLRYLMYKDEKVFQNKTATQIIGEILSERKLTKGELENTSYVLERAVYIGTSLLDIIYQSLDKTYKATGRNYLFYDDCGKLCLKNTERTKLDVLLESRSNIIECNVTKEIDSDTYNYVKLYQEDGRRGYRNVKVVSDIQSASQYGVLGYFERVDSFLNDAQITQKANSILKEKNRQVEKLSLSCIGNTSCRAGMCVNVNETLQGVNGTFLIQSAVHKIDANGYRMELELQAV